MYASTTFEQEHDCRMVALLADVLEISEFDVFAAAFRAWHACEPAPRVLERDFGCYLRDGLTPFWVRDFARKRLRTLGIDPDEPELDAGALLALGLELLVPGLRQRLARLRAAQRLLA